jgi:hypothetical protein
MNPAMRRCALLVMWIAAGCASDPHMRIVVEPPGGDYDRLVTKTVVTVYESELDSLTCAQIEFGDVTNDLLLGAAVAEQTIFAGGGTDGTLDDISRLGKKAVVARLYGTNDVLIAAGCTEQGDLAGSGETTVRVKTIVAATVAIDTLDADDPYGKQITMVDPLGTSLSDREVRWRMFAPAGAVPAASGVTIDPGDATIWDSAKPACTTRNGIARMRLIPPSKVFGYSARFRVSWSASPIEVVSGFVRPGLGGKRIANTSASNRCAIRTIGGRRLVCIEDAATATPDAHAYEFLQGPGKNYSVIDRATATLTGPVAGLFSVDESGGKEVYAVMVDGSVKNVFGTTTLTGTSCPDCAIDDFRVAPSCGNDPARLYLHSGGTKPLRITGQRGGPVIEAPIPDDLDLASFAVTLNSAGCVTTINIAGAENDVQIAVLDITGEGGAVTRGVFKCGAARVCGVNLPFPQAGLAFLRAGTATKPENQMIGTTFDVNGAELVGWVLRPTTDIDTFLLIDRQHIVAAAPPTQIHIGKLDGDDEPDLVWNIRGVRSSILQGSYAHTIEDGSRLSALASLPTVINDPTPVLIGSIDELVVGDLTGDGFDDVVGVTPLGFIAIPQAVDGPPVADRTTETACGS